MQTGTKFNEFHVGQGADPGSDEKPFVCLIADDDETDVLLTRKALELTRHSYRILWVKNGREVLSLLDDADTLSDIGMLLLDLNMPVMNGRDVLARIKNDSRFRALPVVILTTSRNQDDIDFSYQTGANSYVVKNTDFSRYASDVGTTMKYWRDVSRHPSLGPV